MQTVEEGSGSEDQNARVEETETPLEIEISNLRRRWELASVLNFLDVLSPILGKDLKVSAEEIEIGLVKPNAALAHLHIQLLKRYGVLQRLKMTDSVDLTVWVIFVQSGTPPVSKLLDDSDKWVTALSKKLTIWWPWVAEGKNPLVPSKRVEISKYKELDPLDRLLLIKAICEVRADKHDVVSYINDSLKEGTEISSFRKNAFGKVGTSTTYWYDANTKAQSHRLYRETITSASHTTATLDHQTSSVDPHHRVPQHPPSTVTHLPIRRSQCSSFQPSFSNTHSPPTCTSGAMIPSYSRHNNTRSCSPSSSAMLHFLLQLQQHYRAPE